MLKLTIEDTSGDTKEIALIHRCGVNASDSSAHDYLFVITHQGNIRKGKVWAHGKDQSMIKLLERVMQLADWKSQTQQSPIYTFYSEHDERMLTVLENQLEEMAA